MVVNKWTNHVDSMNEGFQHGGSTPPISTKILDILSILILLIILILVRY